MENTTVHLPELYLKLIDIILNAKDYPCMSEFIRIAVRKMLKKDQTLLLNPLIKENSQMPQKGVELQNLSIQKHRDQFSIIQQNGMVQKSSVTKRRGRKESKKGVRALGNGIS
jgi:Arc/MetJ-type ribon-helix-helix transcriptional regulator